MRILALAFAITFVIRANSVASLVAPDVIQSRLHRLRPGNDERAAELRKLFAEAGCDPAHYSESKARSTTVPNIACVVPGASRETIVVTAHYDRHKGPGEGAIDNWSGASMLPSLLETVRSARRHRTFVFLAFADEERGLIGSHEYVYGLTKEQRANVLVNVNIDCVGLKGPLRIAAERADPLLMQFAAIVGDSAGVRVGAEILGRQYDSDASSFAAWKIPVIDFHSLTRDTLPLLHTKRDVRSALDPQATFEHYRFLAAYLEYLDRNVDREPARRR